MGSRRREEREREGRGSGVRRERGVYRGEEGGREGEKLNGREPSERTIRAACLSSSEASL
jgi:hypothetical protein